ncbi:hypothetical protein K501DRAFT_323903 [Backusella circina FSU 941]|nr:hypothetical protein K501DRAFT_323903 [Backusella circina FSU 941]
MKLSFSVLLCLLITHTTATLHKRDYTQRQYYTLHTLDPNPALAQQAAHELGARFEGQVGELTHYYWISLPLNSNRLSKRHSLLLSGVDSIEPQIPKRRLFKRAPPPVVENIPEEYRQNNITLDVHLPPIANESDFLKVKQFFDINDPGFDEQWHLINREQLGFDLNVTGVWSQGITGKGVVVAILDDGIDFEHNDLKDNYFPEGSYDFNEHVPEPRPQLSDDTHGTRCAGEIAAVKNDVCGTGVAYDARVAGIRILSKEITEADEAIAINYEYQKNHIYSCSWGPPDTGEVAEGPNGIILDAMVNGIENGRNGSGSIFVFASGNGGAKDDNCNFDGYTNSIYTITVGAVDRMGVHPYYAESCSAQLVVSYSSGSGGHIYTTDVGQDQCTNSHGGTSAAAPLAAGVFALVLSIRPDLTWRDMQYLCVQSAVPLSLADPDWVDLPSGRKFNHRYGYGVIDAYKMVESAKTFQNVRPQTNLELRWKSDVSLRIPDITPTTSSEVVDKEKALTATIDVTQDLLDFAQLGRVEHVTSTLHIEHKRRGDLEILLESPNGITSQLASPRKNDESVEGFQNWTFMTVKHW